MRKTLKKILVSIVSFILCISMCVPVFAYTALEDDSKRASDNTGTFHVVASNSGMLRNLDEGTTVKISEDKKYAEITVTTKSSTTWGKITKVALVEIEASNEQKELAANDVKIDDTSFEETTDTEGKITAVAKQRVFHYQIPVSELGMRIPICVYCSDYDEASNTWKASWKTYNGQSYYIVLFTADVYEKLIASLPESCGLDEEELVAVTRKCYDALEDKEAVSEEKLLTAEKQIKEAKNKQEEEKNKADNKQDDKKNTPTDTKASVAVGTAFNSSNLSVRVTKAGEVAIQKNTNTKAKKVTIPATISYQGQTFKVTEIANKAFANNKKLTQVVIGKNITKIGKQAFKGDKKLKKITFKGNLVKTVGKKAFSGINKKATFKATKKILKKYRKLIKKAGAPKTAKYKK